MRKNEKYLKFIRKKPCIFCGNVAEPHHIRDVSITPKDMRGGTGLKPSDYMCVPLCREDHQFVEERVKTIEDPQRTIIELLAEYIEGSR